MKRLYVLSMVLLLSGSLLAQRNSNGLSTTTSTRNGSGVTTSTSTQVNTGRTNVTSSSNSSSNSNVFSTYTPPPNNNDRDNVTGRGNGSGSSSSTGSGSGGSGTTQYTFTNNGNAGSGGSSGYNGSSYSNSSYYNNGYYGSTIFVGGGSGYNSNDSYENNSRYISPCATCFPNMYSEPTRGYRVHFSGKMFSDNDVPNWTSIIWEDDDYSEKLGVGKYPYIREALKKSVEYTFDGIAVDSNVRIVIYSQENFQGHILLDVTGPAIINNSRWIDRQDEFGLLKTKTFYDSNLQNEFPPSRRQWSETDMHDWQKGSLIISEVY